MRKIRIKFQIKSLDLNNTFKTNGEFKNNRIIFVDNENSTNYIIFHNESIEYYKKGSMDMKYKFKENTTTKGEYTLNGYKFQFDIITNVIMKSKGLLKIDYDLYQDNDLVNKTEIVLEYTFLEEE